MFCLGLFFYADDLALLAPSPSALCLMLQYCEKFALGHSLRFNAIRHSSALAMVCPSLCDGQFFLRGSRLLFSDSVLHLGHTLRHDLCDSVDILVKTRDMIRKTNCLFHTLSATDVAIKTKLF